MDLAKLKDDVLVESARVEESRRPVAQLHELELALVGGGMGDVLQ